MSTRAIIHESGTPHRTPLGGLGMLFTAGVLTLAADQLGILAGFGVLIIWLLSPSVFTVAVAYLLLAVTAPDPTLLQTIGIGGGTIAILLGRTRHGAKQTTIVTVIGTALLWSVVFIAYRGFERLWLTALLLLGVVTLLLYGVYRYELVRLGLVEVDE